MRGKGLLIKEASLNKKGIYTSVENSPVESSTILIPPFTITAKSLMEESSPQTHSSTGRYLKDRPKIEEDPE